GILSVALSLSFRTAPHGTIRRTVGVTHHRVLWSPDFPLPGPSTATSRRRSPGSDRPAGLRISSPSLYATPPPGFHGRPLAGTPGRTIQRRTVGARNPSLFAACGETA